MNDFVFEVSENINNPAEEAYRVLRTNIGFSSIDHKIKVMSIVSASHSDGKTTTAINLAISMSKSGIKVLLIDADLRKPGIYKHFGGEKVVGLADVIAGNLSFQNAVKKTTLSNFFILTAGNRPPYPTDFLSSNAFNDVLQQARQEYDFVIIDTPAMRSYIDAAVIASKADGVLILVKYKSAYFRSVIRIKKQLEKVNANILGIVLNKVSKNVFRDYYITNHSYSHLKRSFDS